MNLLEDGNESDNDKGFQINENYAKRYDKWRKSEELQKLKDKYGDYAEGDSSTSEEEDEDAVELTEEIEKDFFKTLSCLKQKNPKIYDDKVRFFKEHVEGSSSKLKKKPSESLTMAAYQRKLLLDTNGILEEEDHPRNIDDLPLVEQERLLKDSFKSALKDSDSEGEEDLLKPKSKSKQEQDNEEADYRTWLAGQEAAVPKEEQEEMKVLRDYWTDPKLDDGEKFLRDYILNHRYLEKDSGQDVENLEESDSEGETAKQEEFERKFNFRFEEPDQDFIKRYPRTVEQSMRRKDDRRKVHREEVKARKQAERAQKDEELKRLKALKRAEIMEKIKKLQEVTGNEEMTFQDQDVEGEFDPAEHDKRMSELFNEDYYGNEADEKKPEFPDLDEELEIEKWDDWTGQAENENGDGQVDEAHCEDANFVMDCDYDPQAQSQRELIENSRRKRKRKQSKFAEAASRPKPVFDPKNESFDKYLDEYYALDYEDLIGDIPCRFKYRKVVPNDYGLTVEEILSAPDKELNRWASVKKIMQRRPEHVELYDLKAYQRKAFNQQKKMQCLPSLYAEPEEDEEEEDQTLPTQNVKDSTENADCAINGHPSSKIQKKKKKRKSDVLCTPVADSENPPAKKKKQKLTTASLNSPLSPGKEDTRNIDSASLNLASVEISKPKKKKVMTQETVQNSEGNAAESSELKKKKKKKQKLGELADSLESVEANPSVSEVKIKKKKKQKMEDLADSHESVEDKHGVSEVKIKKKKNQKIKKLAESQEIVEAKHSVSEVKIKKKKKDSQKQQSASNTTAVNVKPKSDEMKKRKRKNRQKLQDRDASSGTLKINKVWRGGKSTNSGKSVDETQTSSISDARLKSYGINPRKYKNKLKYGPKTK